MGASGVGAMGADRAVVIGASMGGLAAARVLADRFDQVILVERDDVRAAGDSRRGAPQARHPHALLRRGAERWDQWLPGLGADLLAAGALPFGGPSQIRWFQGGG